MPKKTARKKTAKKISRAKNKPKKREIMVKRAKKAVKSHKKPQKAHKKAPEPEASIYEEVTITCPGCGRTSKVIKLAGVNAEGLICQRCAKGEIELGEMDF